MPEPIPESPSPRPRPDYDTHPVVVPTSSAAVNVVPKTPSGLRAEALPIAMMALAIFAEGLTNHQSELLAMFPQAHWLPTVISLAALGLRYYRSRQDEKKLQGVNYTENGGTP